MPTIPNSPEAIRRWREHLESVEYVDPETGNPYVYDSADLPDDYADDDAD